MSDTPTPKSTKGRKPKHASGIPGALKDVPLPKIMPDVLTAEFVRDHAGDVLDFVYRHAANDPTTARWLAENIFSADGWRPPVADPHPTPASIDAAQVRAVDAYVAGRITAETLGTITLALSTRMAALDCLESVA